MVRTTAATLAVCLTLPAGQISNAAAAGPAPPARTGAQLEAVAARAHASQPFTRTASGATEFQGLGPSEMYGATRYSWTPGEPVVAVGPNHIVQTVNEAAAVYTKTGMKLTPELDFGTFWGGTTSNPTQCTDPRALYMAGVDRFAISCSSTSMLFAISATGDPRGAWYRYAAPNTSFLDQDKIEATTDKFIIAGNSSNSTTIYVYNLSDVVNHVSSNPTPVLKIGTRSNVYQAVVQQTPTSNAYLVSSFPGNVLDLATISGTPAASNVKLTQTVISSSDYPAPQEPSVPGGNIGGTLMDGRINDAVYEVESSDGKPVIQYSGIRECGTRACDTSARIDLSGSRPVLTYNNLVGEPGYDDTYGAVGLDGAGNVFEVYAQTTAAQTPSAAVVGPGFDVVLQPSTAGTTSCQPSHDPPCDERWGDYFGTAIDPSDTTSIWVTATYQAGNGDYGWGTVIARVSRTAFALPTVTTGSASKVTTTTAHVAGSVNPGAVPTSYHVDYGLTTGYDAATVESSAGSGTTPVNVLAVLSGLQEGTLYHYRVVATTSAGRSLGADRTFRTNGPRIASVTFTGSPTSPTVTINGANLGTEPAGSAAGCGATGDTFGTSLFFTETTQTWTGGEAGDCIGLVVSSYSSTRIVYGFGSFYGTNGLGPANSGDQYTVSVLGKTFSGTIAYQ